MAFYKVNVFAVAFQLTAANLNINCDVFAQNTAFLVLYTCSRYTFATDNIVARSMTELQVVEMRYHKVYYLQGILQLHC